MLPLQICLFYFYLPMKSYRIHIILIYISESILYLKMETSKFCFSFNFKILKFQVFFAWIFFFMNLTLLMNYKWTINECTILLYFTEMKHNKRKTRIFRSPMCEEKISSNNIFFWIKPQIFPWFQLVFCKPDLLYHFMVNLDPKPAKLIWYSG